MLKIYVRMILEILAFFCVALLVSKACSVSNHGLTNQKIVVILDSGLDMNNKDLTNHLCPSGSRDFTEEGLQDRDGHGTFVTSIITENTKATNYCIIIVKYYIPRSNNSKRYIDALRYIINLHPDIVNFSGGGANSLYQEKELMSTNTSMLFIVAAGNGGWFLDDRRFYPASYELPNEIVVGSLDNDGKIATHSNYGTTVTAWELGENVSGVRLGGDRGTMSGTSMATALRTARMIGKE